MVNMLQEIILIFGIIYIILWLFYKDSVSEFRINQVEWGKRGNITSLLSEKSPIVVRGIHPIHVWTYEDVMNRDVYNKVPIFAGKKVSDWIQDVRNIEGIECPWEVAHARMLGDISAFRTWVDRWFAEWIIQPGWKWLWRMQPSCWTGARPMFRTTALWTAIAPTVGEIMVSILPPKDFDYALPGNWRDLWIPRINSVDTPFAGDLKFMDIRLRPGHILLLPAHWYASWDEGDIEEEERRELGLELPVMAVMMEFHTLFSLIEDWKELKFSARMKNRGNGTNARTAKRTVRDKQVAFALHEQLQPGPNYEQVQPTSYGGFDERSFGNRDTQYSESVQSTQSTEQNGSDSANMPYTGYGGDGAGDGAGNGDRAGHGDGAGNGGREGETVPKYREFAE